MTYHIKLDGRPGKCEAKTPGSCPRGGRHYNTELEAAYAAIDIALSKQGGNKVTINEKGMSPGGIADTIYRTRDLHPDELLRLTRQYSDQSEVLIAVVKHPNIDTHILATVLSYENDEYHTLTGAAYNPAVKPEAFDMLIETAHPNRRRQVWHALASRQDLLDHHKEALARTSDPDAGMRYAHHTSNPDHLAILAKSDNQYIYMAAISNKHTTKETLKEVMESREKDPAAAFAASQELLRRAQAKAEPGSWGFGR